MKLNDLTQLHVPINLKVSRHCWANEAHNLGVCQICWWLVELLNDLLTTSPEWVLLIKIQNEEILSLLAQIKFLSKQINGIMKHLCEEFKKYRCRSRWITYIYHQSERAWMSRLAITSGMMVFLKQMLMSSFIVSKILFELLSGISSWKWSFIARWFEVFCQLFVDSTLSVSSIYPI